MKPKKINKFEKMFITYGNQYKTIRLFTLLLSLILVSSLVYFTGGIKYSYSHMMYIPILLAGFSMGSIWGVIIGIIAGILLGPFMPVDVLTKENQLFLNWFYRLIIFSVIGAFSGFLSSELRKYLNANLNQYIHNQETNIPNINSLTENKLDETKRYLAISVFINNFDSIFSILGLEISISMLQTIYKKLKSNLPVQSTIVQSNSNKLWLTIPYTDYDKDLRYISSILEHNLIVEGIPLFIEFSLGGNLLVNQTHANLVKSYKTSDNLARLAYKEKIPFIECNNIHSYINKNSEIVILGSFENALKNDETYLVYHPKIDLVTNKVVGLEALIRWNHPELGPLYPDQFIPLIEETMLIHNLTDWVVNKAVNKLTELNNSGINLIMSINVSALNLYNNNFFDKFVDSVLKHNLHPNQIEIEITESSVMKNPEESKAIIEKLSSLGFIVAIDDFGKAFSSLTQLSSFKVDILKIDRFFINQLTINNDIKSVVMYTINLAHNIGLKVVAEGVETIDQLEILKSLNCNYAQGYYYSKPINPEYLLDWLSNNRDFQ